MNFLSIKSFHTLNLVSAVVLAGVSKLLLGNTPYSKIVIVDIIALIVLVNSIVNISRSINRSGNAIRVTLLLTFISAIILSFTAYFADFRGNTSLFVLTNVISALWLVTMFFTNFKETN